MGIPIVCLGCNERAEIPFIPPDLTCVACKTGEHIDLDDIETTAVLDPTDPMMLLPAGTPDQDQDVAPLRDTDEKRKVLIPKGSAPYSQRALAAGQAGSCSYCGASVGAGGLRAHYEDCPAQPLKENHRDNETRDTDGKFASRKTAAQCPDCSGSGAVPAGGGEDPDDVDNGYVQCPTCKGTGVQKSGSLTVLADFATVLASLGNHNGARVNVTYSSDFRGVTTVSGLLTYASGHATVETDKGLVDIPASQVLAVEKVGYGAFPDPRTEPVRGPSVLDYALVGPSTMAAKTALYVPHRMDADGSGCSVCGSPMIGCIGSTPPNAAPPYSDSISPYAAKTAVYVPHKWVDSDGHTSCIVCGIPEEEAAPDNGPMIGCEGSTPPNDFPAWHDPMDDPKQELSGWFASKTAGSSEVCPKCSAKISPMQRGNTLTAKCASCGWSGSKTRSTANPERTKVAASYEDEDAYDAGFEDGITGAPMATGLAAYAQGYADGQAAKAMPVAATKIFQIAAAVTTTNPGMTGRTALRVARKTVAKYPKVAADYARGVSDAWNANQMIEGGAGNPKTYHLHCEICGQDFASQSPTSEAFSQHVESHKDENDPDAGRY